MKIKITEEQLEITKDNSDFLIVSAGPGSGKTETLSKYIPERAMELTLGKKIIVCSYTVKSTNEIKTRTLRNNGEDGKALSESVIFLTFDSFLMNYFWKYYLNRIIRFISKKYNIACNEKNYKFEKIIYSKKKCSEFKSNYKKEYWFAMEVSEFINSIENNCFLSGFSSDYILFEYISSKENIEVKNYITCFFDRIIIDEAQDFSFLRYDLLLHLNIEFNIKLSLIGDERQTIYQFGGAEPKIFNKIISNPKVKEIKKIELLKNHRYKGMDENIKKLLSSNEENFEENLNIAIKTLESSNDLSAFIKQIDNEDTVFILTDTNNEVESILKLLNDNSIGAYLKIDDSITSGITSLEKEFIENLYAYKLIKNGNGDIKKRIDKERTPSQVIFDFLWPYDEKANEKFLKLFSKNNQNFDDIISSIEKGYEFKINPLWNKLMEDNNYLSILSPRRIQIMTIHGSKGLEADIIFINRNLINDYKNKNYNMKFENMFVALSRVKKEIIIYELE